MQAGNVVLKRGEVVTIDGSTGQVLAGRVPMVEPAMSGEFGTLMGWADKVRKLGVRANADMPADARMALRFGAEGIGLCRTEHMFFDEDRIQAVREMILADDEKSRRAALAKLLPMQRADFIELFEIMGGLPVTIRLLDPPLHEFLPHGEADIAEVAAAMGADPKKLEHRAKELAEFNPMLGFRGCRIAIAYPEIAEMQARAIFEAAVEAGKRTGKPVVPEVMVPLIASKAELDIVKARIDAMAQAVAKETGAKLNYQVGTMIELPRAALLADEIAQSAEFFSFGTNDLTQTTFGISRDDAASFLGHLRRARHPAGRPVRLDRPRRRRRAGADRRRARPQDPQGPQGRHLRRARRRSRVGGVLPRDRARLRVVLAVPGPDCAPCGGAGCVGHEGRRRGLMRTREFVRYGGVAIDVIVEGQGPAIVLLPSLARDSEDYDAVAEGLAAAGYRVLRPQPRGIGKSAGPLTGISLHDLARDVAEVIKAQGGGKAVVVGHAYGNWVARMTAVDHPALVRGVVIAAAAAKQYAPELRDAIDVAGNPALPADQRLKALRFAFFAPGNDPKVWLDGWHPGVRESQRAAAAAVKQSDWWSAGIAPLLDLQAASDPFKPPEKRNEMKDEFGDRVTIALIPDASHALFPEQPKAVVEALVAWIKTLP